MTLHITRPKAMLPKLRYLWQYVGGTHYGWAFVLLLTAFSTNTLLWGIIVQPAYPPDELSHFEYIRYLFEQQALPVYGETHYIYNPALLHAHALLPPLYYLLGVPFLALGAKLPIEMQVVGIRLLSLLIGMGIVTIAYLLGRMLVPARPHFALAFAALVGFNPRFTYMSAAINSDNLVNLIAAALLLTLIYGIKHKTLSHRWLLTMGTLMGLGLITKQTIAVVLLACGIMLVWIAWHYPPPQRIRTLLKMAVWIGGSLLLVSGWYFVHNWVLYGDPTGLSLIGSQATSYIPHPYSDYGNGIGEMIFATNTLVSPFLPTIFRSFWEYFDHISLKTPPPIFLLLLVLTIGGVGGTLLWVMRHWRQRQQAGWHRAAVVSMALLAELTLGSVLSACYRMDYQPQGRYLFSALLPLLLIVLVGWEHIAALVNKQSLVAPLLIATILMINFATLLTTVAPAHHYTTIKKQVGIYEFPGASLHIRPTQLPQLAFGSFVATLPFVPKSSHVTHLDLFLETTTGIQGPIVWRIADQYDNELVHMVEDIMPPIPILSPTAITPTVVLPLPQVTRYTLVLPANIHWQAGEPYVLALQAPNANVEMPLRVYQPDQTGAPLEIINNSRLLELHIGYANKPLDTLLYTISHRWLTDSTQSPLGMVQLALYVLVSGQMVVLVLVVFGVFSRRLWQVVAIGGILSLAVWLFQAEPPKQVPHATVQAERGQLLTLASNAHEEVRADLLFLADSPFTRKDPPATMDTSIRSIQPFTFTLAHQATPVLFMHAASTITYTFAALPSNVALQTAFTLNPVMWDYQEQGVMSDGAEFGIVLYTQEGKREIVQRFLDPNHNHRDRRWFPVVVDLHAYAGQRVQLVFSVLPGPDDKAHFDWGGWRQPMLVDRDSLR